MNGGNSVEHRKDTVSSPIYESPEPLQLQKRGNNNVDLLFRHHSARRGTKAIFAAWLRLVFKGNATMGSCASFRNPDKAGTNTDFSRRLTQPRTIVRQSYIFHIGLSLSGCAAGRARHTRGKDRPANGWQVLRRTR